MTVGAASYAYAFTRVGLVALLACSCTRAPSPDGGESAADPRPAQLTNRVWIGTDSSALGTMLIFLSDGTLVQDSCWETYRLSQWRTQGAAALRWQEDTAEIAATIVALDATALTLRLELVGGAEERDYTAAAVPYVCPDMPR